MISSFAAPSADALVSVIIPCYRHAHLLREAIESVLRQTHPWREIVVVDDGSPDSTLEVATGYRNVIYVRQQNLGLAAARNTGFQHSSGDYLVFLDADDLLTADCFERGLQAFRAHPECGMVSGHWRYMDAGGARKEDFAPSPPGNDPYQTLLERNYIAMNGSVMHRRVAFESIGGFDASLKSCEDYELYMRMVRVYPVFSYGTVVAEYRTYDSSMTKHPAIMIRGIVDVFEAQWPLVDGNHAYLQAFQRGVLLNAKVAYWPLLGTIKRALNRGNFIYAIKLSFRTVAHPVLCLKLYMLYRRATVSLRRLASQCLV